jgi:DNA-binding transcriptional regulator LsrR (DeoR family)
MDSSRLVYRIAQAYYEDGLTQQEIAGRFGISRIKVSRLLARALREKIVRISLVPPGDLYPDLEKRLEEKYGLKEAVVVDAGPDRQELLEEALGRSAADYLLSKLQGNEVVGLTWGRALLSVVNAIQAVPMPGLQVVQLLGGLGEPGAAFHGADLTTRLAQLFSTRPRLIHAPGIVASGETCSELMQDIQVRSTLELAARTDIAVVGIGLFAPGSPLLRSGTILSGADRELLASLGVAGDISLRFFDHEGNFVSTEIDRRIIGLSAEQLGKIPLMIGVAGGKEKYPAIRAAVTGTLLHVLVTDRQTAENLVTDAKANNYPNQ